MLCLTVSFCASAAISPVLKIHSLVSIMKCHHVHVVRDVHCKESCSTGIVVGAMNRMTATLKQNEAQKRQVVTVEFPVDLELQILPLNLGEAHQPQYSTLYLPLA